MRFQYLLEGDAEPQAITAEQAIDEGAGIWRFDSVILHDGRVLDSLRRGNVVWRIHEGHDPPSSPGYVFG